MEQLSAPGIAEQHLVFPSPDDLEMLPPQKPSGEAVNLSQLPCQILCFAGRELGDSWQGL